MKNDTALVWGITVVAIIAGAIYFYAVSNPVLAPDFGGTATTSPRHTKAGNWR